MSKAIKRGDELHGFRAVAVRELPEHHCTLISLCHLKTGMRVAHLFSRDPENLFCFAFRTPPADDTGVAHIVEHAVLSGSRRFPLKDPFAVLLKGSMHTFLNAFTFPDKTVFPASSMLEKDFYNLMLVYGDAVFYPLLRRETFMQEAYRLEYRQQATAPRELAIVGVVYNEMKGGYADPNAVASKWALRSLFPETPYGRDSGGDPAAIPDLTYAAFQSFHRKYYHPSNCWVFLYGDIPTEKHLEFLQTRFLQGFEESIMQSEIADQPRWQAPARLTKAFPANPGDPLTGKSTVSVNWLTVSATDVLAALRMEIVAEILLGNAGSPLRKALVESRLGEDLSPVTGLESEVKQIVFSVGLRGTDPERCEAIENLVLDTLSTLAEDGVGEDAVAAAIHKVEFRHREIRAGGAPYSLKLMRETLKGWLHGMEPEATLEFKEPMTTLKARLAASPDQRLLKDWLRRHLLENPHRMTIVTKPDPEQRQRDEEQLAHRLATIERGLDTQGQKDIERVSSNLKTFQELPDPAHILARIPLLKRDDLPTEVQSIPIEHTELADVPVVLHDIHTNGVVYADLSFSTEQVDDDRLAYLPLFGKAVCGSGLPGVGYDEVARRLSLTAGGFTPFLEASSHVGDEHGLQRVFFRVKALRENLGDTLRLVTRLLLEADFDDIDRMRDLAVEWRNDLRAALIPSGSRFVALRAGSELSSPLRMEERWGGIEQILFFSRFAPELTEHECIRISEHLKAIRAAVVSRASLLLNITAECDASDTVSKAGADLVGSLPPRVCSSGSGLTFGTLGTQPASPQGFAVNSPVGFVATALPAARYGSEQSATQTVLAHLLRSGYLWDRVRVQAGAYGVSATHNAIEGLFTFTSYRDPNIVSTLTSYRAALEQVGHELDERSVEQAVVGTVGIEERPHDPGTRGLVSLRRWLYGVTDAMRQQRRQHVLATSKRSLSESAAGLLECFEKGVSVIMAGENALNEVVGKVPGLETAIVAMPG